MHRLNLELLLAYADDRHPVLTDGLPLDSTRMQLRPAAPVLPTHLWDSGRDPNDLPRQCWGVVAPEGPVGDRLLALIEPLCQLRQEEQGAPVRGYRVPPS